MTKPATNSIQEKENSPTDFPAPHTLDPRFPAFDNWKVPKMKSDLGDLSNLSKALPWFWTFEEAALGYHQKINTRTHIITYIYIYRIFWWNTWPRQNIGNMTHNKPLDLLHNLWCLCKSKNGHETRISECSSNWRPHVMLQMCKSLPAGMG